MYGFLKGHTTVEAIDNVIDTVRRNKNEGRQATFDIENSFNSA